MRYEPSRAGHIDVSLGSERYGTEVCGTRYQFPRASRNIFYLHLGKILSAMDKVPSRYKVPIPTSGGMYSVLISEGDIIGQG